MNLVESFFDITYLVIVISLSIRLLMQKNNKSAVLFGSMGLILGLGDSFHLIPRVMSHFTLDGFNVNVSLLSWGMFITSITMTIFYLLYYFFYVYQTKTKCIYRDIFVYILVIARIVLVLMPQNNWGTSANNYTFTILRNIPFMILGLALVIFSYKKREVKGLKYMALLISLSFLFYVPVFLWVDKVPIIGALMMPKTLAYLLIVVLGYKTFMPEFNKRSLIEISFANLVLALISGVFYREFTKYFNYNGKTYLSKMHPHIIVLGVIFILIIYLSILFLKNDELVNKLKKPLLFFSISLIITVVLFMLHGISQITDPSYILTKAQVFSGLAGIGHTLLSISMLYILLKIYRANNYIEQ